MSGVFLGESAEPEPSEKGWHGVYTTFSALTGLILILIFKPFPWKLAQLQHLAQLQDYDLFFTLWA